jgi:chorismate dehydratase
MLIGDDAISQAQHWPGLYIYDLGELWKRHTGLPFTYALWLVRKECPQQTPDALSAFVHDLDRAKEDALAGLREAAEASPFRSMLSEDDLVAYWRGISYDFGPNHKKGLDLFRQYAEELGLLLA